MQRAERRPLRLGTPYNLSTQPLASSPPGPPLAARDTPVRRPYGSAEAATRPVAPEVRLPGGWAGPCQGAEPQGPPVAGADSPEPRPDPLARRPDPDRLPAPGSEHEVQAR